MNFNEIEIKVPNLKAYQKFSNKILDELRNANDAQTVKKIIFKKNKYDEKVMTDISVIQIRYTIDTTNPEYASAQEKLDEMLPVLSSYSLPIIKEILAKPFRKELEDLLGKYLLQKYQYTVETFDEKIIPEMIEESKLTTEYDKIIGGAKIEYKGKIYNLSQLGKFATSLDREERKEVALLSEKFWKENNDKVGEIYDKLTHLRNDMAKKLGYKTYTELAYKNMGRVDWNPEMASLYRDQIYRVVTPLAKKLVKKQGERLGIKNMASYDLPLSFPDGNAKPIGDCAFLVEQAAKMYDDMSSEIGSFFHSMIDSKCLDLEAKAGKSPGGYMTQLPLYKMPFVFSNFNGTAGDIDVLTHEIGHAFQYHESTGIKIPEYQQPGMEACEIHSMSMEFIAWPWIGSFVGEDKANKYKYAHLSDAIEFLPYGAAIDEFQHYVYDNVDDTHAQRCAKWREIEKKYQPWKKYTGLKFLDSGTWWLRQAHVFQTPFYYLDYTLAQVVAFQFLAESTKNKEKAWKKYVKLCKMGGKYPFTELLERGKLRNPFIDGNIKKSIRPLVKILNELETKI